MIDLLPEPKVVHEDGNKTKKFKNLWLKSEQGISEELIALSRERFWNYQEVKINETEENILEVMLVDSLDNIDSDQKKLFQEQGYDINISKENVILRYENRVGFLNGMTTLKQLLEKSKDSFVLPICHITDWPSLEVRAIAQTFSWYAGYGRFGFDSQLWGFEEWKQYLNICLDNKINQFNLVMYGYWPFEMKKYPETVFRNVPIKIWNAENRRWLTVRYTHPNLEEPFLQKFIELSHRYGVKIFAYVGLNSYNGGFTIKHPEARMKPPKDSDFRNDFDSLCLSYPGNVEYIVESMKEIAKIGFDGYTLEESEEGFWFCECDDCKKRWHAISNSPGEAKHKANMWLLKKIYDEVRNINKDAVIGIRAFRQPPLEKDPMFLKECVDSMPEDIMLFWAPGLYVPESEFEKWCDAFGRDRIWARDTESNSITSTMGRLYRTFKSNVIRYEDETNEQVIETDIRQHRGSVKMGVHEEFGDVILEVRNLTAPKAFRNINLQVREGEVIGLAGLLGAGKTELVQAIFGNHKVTDGEILIKGKPVKIKSPQQAIKLGMGLVPDERRTLGLVMKFDIKDNTVLPSMKLFRKAGVFQDHKAEMKAAYEINEKMNLAYHSLWQNVKKLSGGNQQKIVIAKWMLRDTEIFLLDEPTRGIDIGAKFEIYNLIHELTKQKKAVILVSPEMEELIGLCNRVYVMYEGEILDEVEGERKTQEVIINNLLGVNAE